MGKYKGFAGSGMNANKNMSNVIKQAQKMQAEMEKVQEELEDKVVEGTAGGGAGRRTPRGRTALTVPQRSAPAASPAPARGSVFYFSSPRGGAVPPEGCRR